MSGSDIEQLVKEKCGEAERKVIAINVEASCCGVAPSCCDPIT
jgi:hypothetical protein